ncbi:MAG: alpha/beta fold hydrolase [Cyclobacteriaceae bacterium]|nr:alpha/beta fold hydrolase [Cyclobacteriaceae bacterium]
MGFIHYRDQGTGRPLVFIHGFCDSLELWDDFILPFTAHYRVITLDLPGFGKSDLLPQPFTLDDVGDALSSLFTELNLDQPILVGHSLGGYVSLSLLARHPEQLSGVMLFHSTSSPDSEERKKVRDKVIAFVKENGVAPFVETFVPGLFANPADPAIPGTRKRTLQTRPEALTAYAAAMRDRPDRRSLLASTEKPVAILAGAKDVLIPFQDLRSMVQLAPKTQLFELPDAAHMGMFEAKNQAQNILSSYIRRVWGIQGI